MLLLKTLKSIIDITSNMGWRYILFRIKYELERKTGILQWKFPTNPPFKKFVSLTEWKNSEINFLFDTKENIVFSKRPSKHLEKEYDKMQKGIYTFFSALDFDLGEDYDWVTNPDTGYKYDKEQHCLNIENLKTKVGDIKYVWEKARFSFLYILIRYDYHFDKDCSKEVFNEINDFINKNPINKGPNYNCSQEISLRVFNWIFALNYYKNSKNLTEEIFDKIMNSIYWQIHHVYQNIDFSRIAVRNNHAITETLALYLIPLMFPTIPNGSKWKKKGKEWFEKEIEYQIYEDGTFLQFSMNYHRVVVQLLTLGIQLAHLNNEKFKDVVYERAKKSIEFLNSCQDNMTGALPNYGANDGALFFKLSGCNYRNYKPQLYALASLLDIDYMGKVNSDEEEDLGWFGINKKAKQIEIAESKMYQFSLGGYYILREKNIITFIRCGKYKDRPSQADNLHLDIWVEGENILWDAGSYKYNTSEENIKYFFGTSSHNTIMIENYDQMHKGTRFIWNNWIKECEGKLWEDNEKYVIDLKFKGFNQVDKNIWHKRRILKMKNQLKWTIEDELTGNFDRKIRGNWHVNPKIEKKLMIETQDLYEQPIRLSKSKGYVSNFYGVKEESVNLWFNINNKKILTKISL